MKSALCMTLCFAVFDFSLPCVAQQKPRTAQQPVSGAVEPFQPTIGSAHAKRQIRQAIVNALWAIERQRFGYLIEHFLAMDETGVPSREMSRLYSQPQLGELVQILEDAEHADIRLNETHSEARFVKILTPEEIQLQAEEVQLEPIRVSVSASGWGNDLDVVIAEALKSLGQTNQERAFDEFTKHMLPVAELERWKEQPSVGRELRNIWPAWRDRLIGDFKQMQSLEPVLSSDGQTARFRWFTASSGEVQKKRQKEQQISREVRLQLTGAGWRFPDHTTANRKSLISMQKPSAEAGVLVLELRVERVGDDWRMASP